MDMTVGYRSCGHIERSSDDRQPDTGPTRCHGDLLMLDHAEH